MRAGDGTFNVQSFVQGVAAATRFRRRARLGEPGLRIQRPGQGSRLWAVNMDNDSVSVFDAATRSQAEGNRRRGRAAIQIGGARPRRRRVCSQTSQAAGTVAVVDPPTGLTVAADDPAALGIAALRRARGGSDGQHGVRRRLEATGQPPASLETRPAMSYDATLDVGPHPRHLALTTGGRHALIISRFITPPQPGEGTADGRDHGERGQAGGRGRWGSSIRATGHNLRTSVILQHSDKVGLRPPRRAVCRTTSGRRPGFLRTAPSAWVPSKQDNIPARPAARRSAIFELPDHGSCRELKGIDGGGHQSRGLRRARQSRQRGASRARRPTTRWGVYLFVTLETSRELAVMDAAGAQGALPNVIPGRAPQALAVGPRRKARSTFTTRWTAPWASTIYGPLLTAASHCLAAAGPRCRRSTSSVCRRPC